MAIHRYLRDYRFRGSDTMAIRTVADNPPGTDRELDHARDQGAVGVLSVGATPDDDPLGEFFIDQPDGTLLGFYEAIPAFTDEQQRLALQQKYMRFVAACGGIESWPLARATTNGFTPARDQLAVLQTRNSDWARAFRELWEGSPCPPEVKDILAKLPLP
jgi:hypothetical protein